MRAPWFWQRDGRIARLLDPLGRLYGAATARRVDKAEAPSAEAETVMKEIVTRATYVGPVLESILLEKHELVEWEMA